MLQEMESHTIPKATSHKKMRTKKPKRRKLARSDSSGTKNKVVANPEEEEEEMTVAAAMMMVLPNEPPNRQSPVEAASDGETSEGGEFYPEDRYTPPPTLTPKSPPPEQAPPEIWYHPNSDWEEPYPSMEEPYVTLYEKHRSPRQITSENVTGLCSVAAVQQEVRCGICLECVVRTRIVRECRHRFCEPCVERALQTAKECPICRTPIPSRRSLEPDIKFDELLQSVIGAHLRSGEDTKVPVSSAVLQLAINKKRVALDTQRAIAASNSENKEDENEHGTAADEDVGNMDNDAAAVVREESPTLVKVLLQRLDETASTPAAPSTESLRMPYLKIAGDAPVLVLKNFLRMKHRSKKQYAIWSVLDGGPEILSDNTSLQFVVNNLSDDFEGEYMPLFYRETKAVSPGLHVPPPSGLTLE